MWSNKEFCCHFKVTGIKNKVCSGHNVSFFRETLKCWPLWRIVSLPVHLCVFIYLKPWVNTSTPPQLFLKTVHCRVIFHFCLSALTTSTSPHQTPDMISHYCWGECCGGTVIPLPFSLKMASQHSFQCPDTEKINLQRPCGEKGAPWVFIVPL